ncbi:MAG: O-antigen ligase family protein [bacterium]|nr:O-antigen ligase family protein [bacterium]
MKPASPKFDNYFFRLITVGLMILLVVMPFHGLISVFGGHITGKMTLIQAWKEIIGLIIAGAYALLIIKKRSLIIKLDMVNIIAFLIIIFSLVVSLTNKVETKSLLFGLKTNIEPLVLFLTAQIVSNHFNSKKLTYLLIVPAIAVSALGLVQAFIVPSSFLSNLGYSALTINPLQLVDPALKAIRIFSTLGGPNQLGAYLILPTSLMLILSIKKRQYMFILPFILGCAAIYLTYSRSAWIGFTASLFVILFLLLKSKARYIFLFTIFLVLAGTLVFIKTNTKPEIMNKIQYYLLHGRIFENRIEGSDQNRFKALANGVKLAGQNPFGRGLGSAGPASFKAPQALITENWYLQIAIEVGIAGLVLFIGFFILNLKELYLKFKNSQAPLFLALFAGLIGLSIANLFLHSWADSSLATIFYISLGLSRGFKK